MEGARVAAVPLPVLGSAPAGATAGHRAGALQGPRTRIRAGTAGSCPGGSWGPVGALGGAFPALPRNTRAVPALALPSALYQLCAATTQAHGWRSRTSGAMSQSPPSRWHCAFPSNPAFFGELNICSRCGRSVPALPRSCHCCPVSRHELLRAGV